MNIHQIRRLCPFEEVGRVLLTHILKDYSEPRNKIQSLLKTQALIRVKKGLYIFGKQAALGPYNQEHLANLIYGPSVISLEFALSFHNMIPERVIELTSITPRRNKIFDTPIGRFSYRYLPQKKYSTGIDQVLHWGQNILIASKEKALCDYLTLKTDKLNNINELEEHISENLRIDLDHVQNFNSSLIEELNNTYRNVNVRLLHLYLQEILKK